MSSRPFVTSFYRYKSGVSRSTLAANVAVALARVGKTLLWDLDIEAPRLEQMTALKSGKPIKRQKTQCLANLRIKTITTPLLRSNAYALSKLAIVRQFAVYKQLLVGHKSQ